MTKAIFYTLLIFFLVLCLMFVQLVLPIRQPVDYAADQLPEHHIQIVISDKQSYFNSQFTAGATLAGQEMNTYVEFVYVDRSEPQTLLGSFERGAYSDVDGIAIQTNDPELAEQMNDIAKNRKTKLILYESENPQKLSIPMVGSKSYSIGTAAGELAVKASSGECRVLLVLENNAEAGKSTYENMKVQGVLNAFSPYSKAKIVDTYTLGSQFFAAETLIDFILSSPLNFDTIICFQEESTPLLTQRINDNGLLGEITIIGYGALDETLEYIDRNAVYGIVCPDAYDIGYNTVLQLVASIENDVTSENISTSLHAVTKENAAEFMEYDTSLPGDMK